jgi:type II secretory pathway pseudopilin PulG
MRRPALARIANSRSPIANIGNGPCRKLRASFLVRPSKEPGGTVAASEDAVLSGADSNAAVDLRRRRRAGYLLLEVILALAILTIVVALVFRIIQTTVRVTSDVQYLQSEQEHADGLYELLRKHFDSMPPTAEFQTRRVQNDLELIFLEAPFHFSWTPSGPQFGSTVIAARRQADGHYTLAVVQEPEDASVSYAASGQPANVTWVPVVSGLREFNWRFFDGHTHEWKTDWKDPGAKPTLFECTFEVSGQAGPTRAVFRWPIAPVQ